MCTVRRAKPADLDTLTEMGERFLAYSPLAAVVGAQPDALRATLSALISSDTMLAPGNALVLVAERDGDIIGALVALLTPVWFAPRSRIATELAWWVDEAHRGGKAALKLHDAFEQWALASGAQAQVLSDLVIDGEAPAGKIIERLGYRLAERAHLKVGGR